MPSHYWFTTYTDTNWTPDKGYNEIFASIVRIIRDWFKLVKISPGIEVGTNYWKEYVFTHNETKVKRYITVDKFVWNHYKVSRGELTPVLYLDFRMASDRGNKYVFYDDQLVIKFGYDYPRFVPYIRVNNPKYSKYSGHEHHLFGGGWICTTSSGFWSEKDSTIITVINWALEWVSGHYHQYGW